MRKIITNNRLNNKGFSLIELMVVVAIIGILAAVGIPQYAKFQAKTRQSEAKSHLNALYVSQTSFASEWNQYTADLRDMGFGVVGNQLRYTAGFDAAAANYTAGNGAPPQTAADRQAHVAAVNTSGATWHAVLGIGAAAVAIPATAIVTNTAAFTPVSFVAMAVGDPRNTPVAYAAATSDAWSIDQNKVITYVIIGM